MKHGTDGIGNKLRRALNLEGCVDVLYASSDLEQDLEEEDLEEVARLFGRYEV